MGLAILADFDGTVTETDASFAILDRFAVGDWKMVEEEAYAGRYTILQALRVQAGMVRGEPSEIDGYVLDTVQLRKGFAEFAGRCRDSGVHLEICSDGFGHTIPLILAREGLEWIPWTSNRTWYERGGMGISFDNIREGCPINANCKCSHYERLLSIYGKVLYVGDGGTDSCVAEKVSTLFARDWLASHCERKGIRFSPWSDWYGIWDDISRDL